MSNEKKTTVTVGFPTGTILTLIFVTLKLMGYIDWSWWWVLSPIWIGLGLVVVLLLILLLIAIFTK